MKRSQAWDVFVFGRKIETVFFDADMTAEEVKRSLVNHDGFVSIIMVQKS